MLFIVNKNANLGIGYKKFIKKILPFLKKTKLDFTVKITQTREEAVIITKRAVKNREKIIVACGGDGTVNSIGQVLLKTTTTLGILPIGSANDFANESLAIPQNFKKALKILFENKALLVDAAKVQEYHFLNVFGFGISSNINHLAHKHPIFRHLPLKELRYGLPFLDELINFKAPELSLKIDGKNRFEGKAFFISAYNGKREGAYFRLNKRGSISDGFLNLILIEDMPFKKRLEYVLKVMADKFEKLPAIKFFQGKEIQINIKQGFSDFLPAQIDGEPIYLEKPVINLSILPKALRVIAGKVKKQGW